MSTCKHVIQAGSRCACMTVIALMLMACVSRRDWMDYDQSAMFSGYHTFAWMPREHRPSRDSLVAQRAHEAIEADLVRKGYGHVTHPADADFIIDFTIGPRDRIDVQSYPRPYFIPDLTVYSAWWGYRYWGPQIDLHQYREGTLALDVFDPVSRMPVWHGAAAKELTRSDRASSAASIRAVAQAVLQGFPPR